MATWGEILQEIRDPENRLPNGNPDFDKVRRKYISALHALTGRATIAYSTAWTTPRASSYPPEYLSVILSDVHGFMESVAGTEGDQLDLILHSPGGTAEAAESIVEYLRTRFRHIRVFVPLAAMSAATMIALGGDETWLGKHSQLGPIDPQFTIQTPEGPRSAPAKAILDQFEQGKGECAANPQVLAAWLPILRSYAPGLLAQCQASQQLAKNMVQGWLTQYMMAGHADPAGDAESAAKWFAEFDNFGSHGRAVRIDDAAQQRIEVRPLEADQQLQDAVLSVFHAISHTFASTSIAKMIENHNGKLFATTVARSNATPVQLVPVEAPASMNPPGSQPLTRQQRRANQRRGAR